MQREPIQFGAVTAARAKRSAVGFSQSIRGARESASNKSTTIVLDEAFADYSRVDAGTPSNEVPATSIPNNWQSVSRDLIADIAAQLETLDSQRRRLARLLEGVNTDATV